MYPPPSIPEPRYAMMHAWFNKKQFENYQTILEDTFLKKTKAMQLGTFWQASRQLRILLAVTFPMSLPGESNPASRQSEIN